MADVSGTLDQWSTTASSNGPAGTTVIGTGLDDNLREIQKVVRAGLAFYNSSAVASSGTTDLGAQTGNFLDISGTTTITGFGTIAAGIWKVIRFQDALTLTYNATSLILPGAANITTAAGDIALVYSLGSGNWQAVLYQRAVDAPDKYLDSLFRLVDNGDVSKQLAFEVSDITTATTRTLTVPDYDFRLANVPAGCIMDFAGSTLPTGWLECDGSSLLQATYPNLFTAIGTTWGSADGTHFNLPDFRGRYRLGKGTGATIEAVTASVGNGFTVAANNTKWVTGMPVVLSNLATFTISASAGPTYYIYRTSSTNVRLCSTLAIAQNATTASMETISGSGTATLTSTLTARTLAEIGGEETHAMSNTEQLAHTHALSLQVVSTFNGSNSDLAAGSTGSFRSITATSTGGNAAMNVMSPYGTVMTIISY